MKLDRDLQRAILQTLADAYPTAGSAVLKEVDRLGDEDQLVANMLYLEEHRLLTSGVTRSIGGKIMFNSSQLKITAKGLDFLADDGGLSAILGVVTIKIHDDQIRLMLASRIQESDKPEAEKRRWLDQLHEIPADATKHLIHKLIDAGLAQWPAVLDAVQTLGR